MDAVSAPSAPRLDAGVVPGAHTFRAVAFIENFSLKELARAFPDARVTAHELCRSLPSGGDLFVYPFGAVVFRDATASEREEEMSRLRAVLPNLTAETVREDFLVREEAEAQVGLAADVLVLDRLTRARAGIVALIVAQSAAMEYYERIVDRLALKTNGVVGRLEARGTVPLRTGSLHRFIGEAIGTRSEVLGVLHLLDKPDATWDDPAMDRIYGDLREEFDLTDRYQALEQKLRGVQEALELVLGVARDRRLFFLEVAIGLLILFEVILAVVGRQ
jgi:uncharacterized Rmd1/YagE family protein